MGPLWWQVLFIFGAICASRASEVGSKLININGPKLFDFRSPVTRDSVRAWPLFLKYRNYAAAGATRELNMSKNLCDSILPPGPFINKIETTELSFIIFYTHFGEYI